MDYIEDSLLTDEDQSPMIGGGASEYERTRCERTYMIICELDTRNHHDTTVSRFPIIVTDQTTLAR